MQVERMLRVTCPNRAAFALGIDGLFEFFSTNTSPSQLRIIKYQTKTLSDGSMTYMPTFYEILGLPQALHNGPSLPAQTLRTAYRRALLQNHPDKSTNHALTTKETIYSIDQITEAFATLSDPKSRTKYDQELKFQNATNVGGVKGRQVFRTGIETMDLDDLEVNETQGIWYRSCRCGDERGFLIQEADLEEAGEDGEISVGCRGCSLWLKVLFGVVEDDAEGDTAAAEAGNTNKGS